MSDRDDYFARVAPLIGPGLAGAAVRVFDAALTGRVVELLASCMLGTVVAGDASPALADLAAYLQWKNGFAPARFLRKKRADAVLRGVELEPGSASFADWDRARRAVTLYLAAGDAWAARNVSYGVARRLRDVLLGRAEWPEGEVYHGTRLWPFAEGGAEPRDPMPAPPLAHPGAHVMVIGAGSVGSEAVRLLAGRVRRMTLVDDARVTIFNPQRQWFGTREIGRSKVECLAGRIGRARVRRVAHRLAPADRPLLESLLDAERPDAVLLATGTSDDAAIAEVLVARGIPHVVAYAYPQARFFEVTVVQPGTPCLHCYRGHLFRGRESAPPMTDETARFLYQSDDATRADAYRNLVAEPASAIETGRIAEVAWLCLTELLAPAGARSPWFGRALALGTNCFLGGNVVERHADGGSAYGLEFPGQVVRLGTGDIAGAGDQVACAVCGRRLAVTHALELPAADAAAADAVLLS